MKKIKINPERLDWCLRSFNISLEKLHQKFSFLKDKDKEIFLTIKQLEKIAKHFNKGMLFFLDDKKVEEDSIYSTQFRTINNQKPDLSLEVKKLIERVELQRDRYIGLLEDLSIPLENWKPNFPHGDIVKIRHWLNLKQAKDFNDIRQSIEDKGIMVFVTNGYAGNWQIKKNSVIRGFSLHFEKLPVIVVKKQVSRKAQTFTLIHELAHLLLHAESRIDDDDDLYSHQGKEQEANEFAGKVLVPDDALQDIKLPKEISEYDSTLADIAKGCCVSVEVILRRLLINKKISQESYSAYREYKYKQDIKQSKSSGGVRYRDKEPIHIFGEPFVKAVFSAYYEKHITLFKTSTYLDNIKIADVHKLENHLV